MYVEQMAANDRLPLPEMRGDWAQMISFKLTQFSNIHLEGKLKLFNVFGWEEGRPRVTDRCHVSSAQW